MKRIILLAAMLVLLLAVLCGCCLKHDWKEATCEEPVTCAKCGETEGEALGHAWVDADCVTAKTCSVCDETEGEALGHRWEEATCEKAQTCSVCGEEEGVSLGHDLQQNITVTIFNMTGDCARCSAQVTAPVDWSVVSRDWFPGKWNGGLAIYRTAEDGSGEFLLFPRMVDISAYYIDFYENGTLVGYFADTEISGTWEVSEKLIASQEPGAYIIVVLDQGGTFSARIARDEPDTLYMYPGNQGPIEEMCWFFNRAE